jgi:hypothetical protein
MKRMFGAPPESYWSCVLVRVLSKLFARMAWCGLDQFVLEAHSAREKRGGLACIGIRMAN